MGVEPFLLASSLVGVLAQRLLRRLCLACREPYVPDAAELALFEGLAPPARLYRATGCAACNRSGYLGRMGIYELLDVDDALRHMIHERASDQVIRNHCLSAGTLRPLKRDGLRWVANGDTTLEEVLRVTRD